MPPGISKRLPASIRACGSGRVPVRSAKAKRPQRDGTSRTGLEMCVLIKFWGGRQLYVERDRWSSSGGFVEWRAREREILIWIGRWHLIYTPAGWSVPTGPLCDGGAASRG